MKDTAQNGVQSPPPSGDPKKAQKYLDSLIDLIKLDKLLVHHSDLKKFDPTSIQDHFRVRLHEYEVEISHSRYPDSDRDSYVMLFTNAQQMREGLAQQVILAFMYLTSEQFQSFKHVATEQIERKRKEEEEKRFQEAMAPVEQVLEKLLEQNIAQVKTDNPLLTPSYSEDLKSN